MTGPDLVETLRADLAALGLLDPGTFEQDLADHGPPRTKAGHDAVFWAFRFCRLPVVPEPHDLRSCLERTWLERLERVAGRPVRAEVIAGSPERPHAVAIAVGEQRVRLEADPVRSIFGLLDRCAATCSRPGRRPLAMPERGIWLANETERRHAVELGLFIRATGEEGIDSPSQELRDARAELERLGLRTPPVDPWAVLAGPPGTVIAQLLALAGGLPVQPGPLLDAMLSRVGLPLPKLQRSLDLDGRLAAINRSLATVEHPLRVATIRCRVARRGGTEDEYAVVLPADRISPLAERGALERVPPAPAGAVREPPAEFTIPPTPALPSVVEQVGAERLLSLAPEEYLPLVLCRSADELEDADREAYPELVRTIAAAGGGLIRVVECGRLPGERLVLEVCGRTIRARLPDLDPHGCDTVDLEPLLRLLNRHLKAGGAELSYRRWDGPGGVERVALTTAQERRRLAEQGLL